MADAELKIRAKIIGDPRLVSGAKLLDIPPAFFLGTLLHLLCKALEYAEDGDMWRGDEDASIRFVSASAAWPGEAEAFVSVLRGEGWLEEWMIADWLDYAGEYLYRKYKTGNRDRLVEIHAKNGREYGARNIRTASFSHPQGCKKGENGLFENHPLTHNPLTLIPPTLYAPEKKDPLKTPIPSALKNEEKENPEGVAVITAEGGTADAGNTGTDPPQGRSGDASGALFLSAESLWEQGIALSLEQFDCSVFTYLEVFTAFKPVLVFHSVATVNSFYYRCRRCECDPARWAMVYMDKVHAVYRARPEGQPWLEDGADPVALTMAALLPSYGRRHSPTEAARQLFLEIMVDYQRQKNGQPSRWKGCVSGNFLAHELGVRKGKAGKIA